jgi:peptidoglycan/xylan/chitin deacetylase (PgdA/CDA1 family)
LSYDQNYDEINVNHKLVQSIIDVEMNLFAPPSGSFNKATLEACSNLGYQTIMWSKDTIDWRDKDSNIIYNRATNNIIGGDLILVHPTENTLKALPLMLEFYKLNNLNVTTVSECLK